MTDDTPEVDEIDLTPADGEDDTAEASVVEGAEGLPDDVRDGTINDEEN